MDEANVDEWVKATRRYSKIFLSFYSLMVAEQNLSIIPDNIRSLERYRESLIENSETIRRYKNEYLDEVNKRISGELIFDETTSEFEQIAERVGLDIHRVEEEIRLKKEQLEKDKRKIQKTRDDIQNNMEEFRITCPEALYVSLKRDLDSLIKIYQENDELDNDIKTQ